jgi:hypothetical protein
MRICVVSHRNATRDPAMRALIHSLHSAGHEVIVVCPGTPEPGLPGTVRAVAPAAAQGRWRSIIRRLRITPAAGRDRLGPALRDSVAAAQPDLIYPHRAEDMAPIDGLGIPIVRQPEWPRPRTDLITLAPQTAIPRPSPGREVEIGGDRGWPAGTPAPGRHRGRSVAIAYRVTPTNPGRYLEAALRRSGASVTVLDGELDWGRVPTDAAFVVIVESPYPALEVRGAHPGVPTLFWIHHGEHHLAANLRLTARYRAKAVLLAHSWHLAHRFGVPVHRFPFAVAPELLGEAKPWSERPHDVAMVAAGVGGSGGRYDRRRHLIETLEGDPALRTRFSYGLPPEEMISLYEEARIVINDGGRRHLPVTMRVFETLGAGALLLTEDLPGTDAVLRPHEHYVPMDDDILAQVRTLLEDDESTAIAAAGHAWAMSRHTYDHRVDQLFDVAAQETGDEPALQTFVPASPLAGLIDRDVEVQHLAVFGETGDLGLHDRAVRLGDVERLGPASIDAVAIGSGPVAELGRAVHAARGYVYAHGDNAGKVAEILARDRPDAVIGYEDGLLRADLGGTDYRMRTADHPLAL